MPSLPAEQLPQLALAVLALLAGLAFCLPPILRWNMNTHALIGVLDKLLAAGELERAFKLTRAAPQAMVMALAGPILERAGRQPAPTLDELGAITRDGLTKVARRLRTSKLVGVVALGLLGLSAASGLLAHTPVSAPGWTVDGFSVLSLAMGWKAMSRVRDGVQRLPVALLVPLMTALGAPTPTAAEVLKAVEG